MSRITIGRTPQRHGFVWINDERCKWSKNYEDIDAALAEAVSLKLVSLDSANLERLPEGYGYRCIIASPNSAMLQQSGFTSSITA